MIGIEGERLGPVPSGRRITLWTLNSLAIVFLALIGVRLQANGLPIAIWWPAAGVSVAFALRVAPQRRWTAIALIFGLTALANAIGGRPWQLWLLYGLFNAIEIALVVALLRRRGARFRLDSLTDAARFVGAVLLGAAVAAAGITTANVVVSGGTFLPTSIVIFASHSSAMMLIGSLAILPRDTGKRVRPVELIAHVVVVGGAVLLAFGPPGYTELSFLTFAVLAAGCLRFPVRVAIWSSLVTSVTALLLTLTSGGTAGLGTVQSAEAAVTLVVFMSAIGLFTVLVSVARFEGRTNAAVAVRAAEEIAAAERARASAMATQLDLERQREDFVTAASHELRTPVTNVLGYADLLSESDLTTEQRSWVDATRRGAARLAGLLDGLTQAASPGERVRVAVDELVGDVRAAHHAEAVARRTELVTTKTGLHVIAVDADARRALWSLVANAVTFAEAGTVEVSASRIGDDIAIVVADDGPGMSPETLAHAFERFFRGREAEGRTASGLGLGLATARDLARRNGGDITLTSSPGQGVVATLRLPAAPTTA
ncbi:sensor histidine kinase [Microbacterium oleivorans]|uniref:sensor histidine kinase n=1 Tax=Microbacterium oleivorans TaxID=273677 RepID=UPI00203B86C1|nr:HAMP domain-containing sensor histidine kinase [Microbacterium oleivorans]MCM3697144.1 ATP-binding protein [Microbacterium oleivorans]